ncbi:ER membrane protein complex subunit 7-like [Ylistrum balloti]|uniref:ER membrane protein complex subunit 7-like n=1 Tax=Ylistrum balloti TaxID=509963 RepID=UPI002905D8EC|nr:ER membrane protein complex subunit 7-like [Ylistrum balloti]
MGDHVPWVLILLAVVTVGGTRSDGEQKKLFSLEGKVELLSANDSSWISKTRVLVNGGKYQGFIRTDGKFTVNGLPNGIYVVEVTHSLYEFCSARVYIYRDGRKRASKVDYVQPNHIRQIEYPLVFRMVNKSRFFQERSSLKLDDIINNPMVVTVLLPLMILLLFPKILSQSLFDPKVQEQFRQQLSTMTGGRGGMIGMGLEEGQEDEVEEEELGATKENSEAKKKKTKKKQTKKNELNVPPFFSFDLAEWLADYFYEEKPTKLADNRSQPKKAGHHHHSSRRHLTRKC